MVPLFCTGPKEAENEGGGTQIIGRAYWRLWRANIVEARFVEGGKKIIERIEDYRMGFKEFPRQIIGWVVARTVGVCFLRSNLAEICGV